MSSRKLTEADLRQWEQAPPNPPHGLPLATDPGMAWADAARRINALKEEVERLTTAINQHRIDLLETPNRTWSADERLWDAVDGDDDA